MSHTVAPEPMVAPPRRHWGRIVAVILVLVGVAALLYPVVTTQYNNRRHHEFAEKYGRQIEQVAPHQLSESLKRARQYNDTLDGVPILDPWLMKVTTDGSSAPYRAYLEQLKDVEAMARIRVPSVGIDLPVRHGTTDDVITTGAGHLYGTSLPVGGAGTHAVLTSHTGMGDASLFDNLTQVQKGQLMFVDVAGETLAYKVDQIRVVLPTEIKDLTPVAGQDHLTLFTCTPYAVNTHRLLVRGERVPYTPELAQQHDTATRENTMAAWMWWLIAGAVLGLGIAVIIVATGLRERRRYEESSEDDLGVSDEA